jgi:nitrogenase subunit NifH
MIDPVTAIAAASKAFAMTKAMVEAGRSAEDTLGQVAKWYGAASDVLFDESRKSNPNPFKKLVFAKSAEAEAIEAFSRKKKIESQRKELHSIIGMAYGNQGLQELRDIKKQVIKQRQDAVYRQYEMKEQILTTLGILSGLSVIIILTVFIIGGFK